MSGAPVVVLWGPPCSGKSSYINARAKPGDVRIDLDALALAIAPVGTPHHGYDDWHVRLAMDARQAIMDNFEVKVPDRVTVWVIDSNADKAKRHRWHRHGARVVKLDVDYGTCVARAREDGRPESTLGLINSWFAKHRPAAVGDVPRPPVEPSSGLLRTSRDW